MAARVSAIEAVGAADPSAKPTLPSRFSALLRSLVPRSSGAPGSTAVAAPGVSSMPVTRPAAMAGRHVQGRVGAEEAERPEGEVDPLNRHDRPVLGPRDVMAAEGVPQHDVGVLDRPV